jgi:molybdenum cofactor biosynthesis protein B
VAAVSVERHREAAGRPALGFAVITASDTRTAADDRSGPLVRERAESAGHRVASAAIVPDQDDRLAAAVLAALGEDDVDVVVVTGGTGFAPRDRTVEAIVPLFERVVEGFGELFRRLSFDEIGAAAMLSRATAGTRQGRAIFLLPGSPAAVRLALDRLILPEVAHLLAQARRQPD